MVLIPFTEVPQVAYVRRAATPASESVGGGVDGPGYSPPLVDQSGALGIGSTVTIAPRREAEEVAQTSFGTITLRRSPGGTLKALPKPNRLATQYEAHFVHRTTQRLLTLFEAFRESLGSAAAAARAAELRLRLADAYREGVARTETRDFATAISILQDLLKLHWSNIPPEKLQAISERLRRLDIAKEITPSVITRFYGELATALGSGIVLEMNDGNDGQGDSWEAGEVPE